MRDGREHFLAILLGDVTLFAEMLPKVLAGCLIGAFVTLLLPREMVARWVGHESGFLGLLIAAFFGFRFGVITQDILLRELVGDLREGAVKLVFIDR